MESIPEKKQKNPGVTADGAPRVMFASCIMQLHKKLNEIESNDAISPEARGEEAGTAIGDFYDYLAMDKLLALYSEYGADKEAQ